MSQTYALHSVVKSAWKWVRLEERKFHLRFSFGRRPSPTEIYTTAEKNRQVLLFVCVCVWVGRRRVSEFVVILNPTTKDYTRADTNFNLSPIYSSHKSSNHKFPKTHKICPDTNLHKTCTNVKHQIFEELVPSVLPLLLTAGRQTQNNTQPKDEIWSTSGCAIAFRFSVARPLPLTPRTKILNGGDVKPATMAGSRASKESSRRWKPVKRTSTWHVYWMAC